VKHNDSIYAFIFSICENIFFMLGSFGDGSEQHYSINCVCLIKIPKKYKDAFHHKCYDSHAYFKRVHFLSSLV